MKYYFSKETNGFYLDEIHKTSIPSDAIPITENEYNKFIDGLSKGKVLKADIDGKPILVDFTITWQHVKKQRDYLLLSSDWTVLPDANPKPSKQAWLEYRQALRDVTHNFNTPDNVVWPTMPVQVHL